MKKFLLCLVAIITIFVATPIVLAADFTTSISGNSEIETGNEFTLTFKVTGNNIWGVVAKLNYDTNKLSIVSSEAGTGFALTLGTNIVTDSASAHNGTFTICTIKFKATSTFKIGESTNVSISNVSGSNGEADLSGATASKSIKVVAPKSTNNYLNALTLSEGKISFNKTKTSYSIVVENKVDSITIGATTEDSKATVSGTGVKKLSVYSNTFKIVVTSESGAKKTYTVVVKRKDEAGNTAKLSEDNTLSELNVAGFTIPFDKTTMEYTLEVENSVNELEIVATPSDSGATVVVKKPDKLVVGENIYTVVVTSKSGEENTYTIKVTKKSIEETPKPIDTPKDDTKNKNDSYSITYYVVIGALSLLLIISVILNVKFYNKIKK